MPGILRRAKVLAGWLSENEGPLYLTNRRADLVTDEHRQRVAAARAAVMARPEGIDQTNLLSEVPASLNNYINAFWANPATEPFRAEGWVVAIADLTRVCAVQPLIFVDHAAERVATVDRNDIQAIAAVTLPNTNATSLAVAYDPTKQVWVFSSANPNLRILGNFNAELPGGLKGFGFAVGVGTSFVQVARYQNRFLLRDGYHRAFGLLSAGVTHAPVLTRDFQTFPQLNLPAGLLDQDEFLGARPPQLPDYLNDAFSAEVEFPATEKVVLVQGLEVTTLA